MSKQPVGPLMSVPKETSRSNAPGVSRRRFGRNAAAMAAVSLSSSSLLGLSQPSPTPAAVQTEMKPEDLAKLGITPEQAREVEAKLANIVRKYGDRLSPEQRDHLRRILAYNERMLAGVRAFAVQNGDPPASVLRVSFAHEEKLAEPSASRSILKPQRVIPRPKR